jgi:hypothetical protein
MRAMTKHHVKRFVGFTFWAVAFTFLLPPTLLDGDHAHGLFEFLQFTAMIVLLFGGYALIDSANAVLKRRHRGQKGPDDLR